MVERNTIEIGGRRLVLISIMLYFQPSKIKLNKDTYRLYRQFHSFFRFRQRQNRHNYLEHNPINRLYIRLLFLFFPPNNDLLYNEFLPD